MRLIAVVAIAALIGAPLARADSFADVSFSDATHAWALVASQCPAGSCTAVESTSDGGRSWRRLATLPASARLQRIDRRAGLAFGQAGVFAARAGGGRWSRVPGRMFESVVPLADATFALTYDHSGCPGPCDIVVRRAASGSGTFAAVPGFRNPSEGFGDELVGAGTNLYAVGFGHVAGGAQGAYARLAISRDGGRSWSLQGDPCRQKGAIEIDATDVVAAGRQLALLCVVRTTGRGSIALSKDAGRSFTRLRLPANGPGGDAREIAIDGAGDLAILDTVSFSTGSADRLTVSYDAGRTWREVVQRRSPDGSAPEPPSLTLLGRSLRWLAGGGTLLRSDDDGRTWQTVTAP